MIDGETEREYERSIYSIINLEKVYDRVLREVMWWTLQRIRCLVRILS